MRWTRPAPQGEYFIIPITALTDTEQWVGEKRWILLKDVDDMFFNLYTALKQLLEYVIDDAYHSGATAMGQR